MDKHGIAENLSALAEERHPASLPSRADLDASGMAGFAIRIDENTPLQTIVQRIFKELKVPANDDLILYVDEQVESFSYREQQRNGLRSVTDQPEMLTPQSALRVMFAKVKGVLRERNTDRQNLRLERVDQAERIGCFIVEQALQDDQTTIQPRTGGPLKLRTAS